MCVHKNNIRQSMGGWTETEEPPSSHAPMLPWMHLLSVIPQGVEQGRSYGLWLRKPVDSVKADTVHKA